MTLLRPSRQSRRCGEEPGPLGRSEDGCHPSGFCRGHFHRLSLDPSSTQKECVFRKGGWRKWYLFIKVILGADFPEAEHLSEKLRYQEKFYKEGKGPPKHMGLLSTETRGGHGRVLEEPCPRQNCRASPMLNMCEPTRVILPDWTEPGPQTLRHRLWLVLCKREPRWIEFEK